MRSIFRAAAALPLLALALPARAQTLPDTRPCAAAIADIFKAQCYAAAQALASAYPQAGIRAAAGSFLPGVEGTRGLTLGIVPRTSLSLRVNAVSTRLPDLNANSTPANDERSDLSLAVKLNAATRLYGGMSAGTLQGIGAVDLLLEGGILPAAGQQDGTAAEWAAGARVGILGESFATPGVALSVVYRRLGAIKLGDRCLPPGPCSPEQGSEVRIGTDDVSARLTVGKRVGPVGLLAGAGWDRFGLRDGSVARPAVAQEVSGDGLHDARWSVFGSVAKSLLVGQVVLEGGWMSGGTAVDGYDASQPGAYDPAKGTAFGSLALRVQL